MTAADPSVGAGAPPPVLSGLRRNAGTQLVARLLGGLAQALALVLIARELGPADYGVFALIFTLTILVGTLADWGLILIGTRTISTRPEIAERMLPQVLGLRLALGAAGIVLLVALAFASSDAETVHLGALIAGSSLLPQAWLAIAQIRAQVDMRLERIAVATLAASAVTLVWIVVALALGGGILLLSGSLLASALASAIAAARLTPGSLGGRPRCDLVAWRRLLRDSTPLGIAVTFVTVYFYIDVALLARLSTTEQVGLYDSAYRFVQFGVFLPSILISSIYGAASSLAEHDRARFAELVRQLLSVTMLVAPLPLLVLALLPSDVLRLVYTDEFATAGSSLTLLACALVAMTFSGIVGPLLVTLHRERATLKISAVAAGFNLAANAALIPVLEADGAALVTLLTELVVLVPASVLLRREAPGLGPGRRRIAAVLASLAVGAAVIAVMPGGVVIRLLAGVIVYVAMLLITRAAGRELLALTRTVDASVTRASA